MLHIDDHSHPVARALVQVTGVAYFLLWSYSFYPQLILNFRRKTTLGLSADFIYLNPLGFLCLTLWSFGAYFSPLARAQYAVRHSGHLPQVSPSDLGFALHAFLISSATLLQAWYYDRQTKLGLLSAPARPLHASESSRLLDQDIGVRVDLAVPVEPIRPSLPCQIAMVGIFVIALGSGGMVWAGKMEVLDWLYVLSSLKLFVTTVKYIPQILLDVRLKSAEGFAVGQVTSDLAGAVLSFVELVVSSTVIDHAPVGIIANPVKLGLSIIGMVYDTILISHKYYFYPLESPARTARSGDDETE